MTKVDSAAGTERLQAQRAQSPTAMAGAMDPSYPRESCLTPEGDRTDHLGVTLRPALGLALACLVTGTAACGKDTPTSATTTTTTTTTTTVAAASTSEQFAGTVPVSGSRFYSFEVGTYGTVTVTLDRVGGSAGVPSSVWVGLGLGIPEGTDCGTTTSLNTQSGAGPHVSSTLAAGTYCARVYDIGNLAGAAPFSITIAHP